MTRYHNRATTSNALQKGFHHNKIPLLVVKGTMTTNANVDTTNKTTAVDASDQLVIADKIILYEAAAEKEMDLRH